MTQRIHLAQLVMSWSPDEEKDHGHSSRAGGFGCASDLTRE